MELSDHSKDCSAGAANIVYNLIVSAPYCCINSSGSTPLSLDLLILDIPSLTTGYPSFVIGPLSDSEMSDLFTQTGLPSSFK